MNPEPRDQDRAPSALEIYGLQMFLLQRFPRMPNFVLVQLAAKIAELPDINARDIWGAVTFYVASVHGPYERRYYYSMDLGPGGRGNADDWK